MIGAVRADLHVLTPPAPMAVEQAAALLEVLRDDVPETDAIGRDLLAEARDHVKFLIVAGAEPGKGPWLLRVLSYLTPQGEA